MSQRFEMPNSVLSHNLANPQVRAAAAGNRAGNTGKLHGCWQTAGVVFVADALEGWLVEQLADADRKKLTELILGSEQERALRRAATAAVWATAEETSPSRGVSADQVATVISEVFRDPVPDASPTAPVTLLEGLQAGIARQLAVLDDAELTGPWQSSADVLGVPGSVLADRLTGHLMREIIVRGSGGRPLAPLVDALADRAAFDDLRGVARQLDSLRAAGAADRAAALAGRAAAHAPLDDPGGVATLLDSLREAGADEQAAALLARDPAAHAALDDPGGVATLLDSLRAAGADDQTAALAGRAAAHAALDDPGGVASLLEVLRRAGADEQAAALLARDPAAHAALDDPGAVASLLEVLRRAGADEQAAALLARDPAAHAALDDPGAVATLLVVLREAGADEQAAALLARDPAAHAALDDPDGVATLLVVLREAGADEQAAALLARDPAADVALDVALDVADDVVLRLDSPRRAGADDQTAMSPAQRPTGGGEPPYSRGGGSGGPRQRYLKGRCPESIPVGEPFGLVASIVVTAGPGSAVLKDFDVPRDGRDVLLEAYVPPGLRLLGHRLLTVHVPADGDSEPVMFELRADEPGVRTVSVTAWIGGSYLGELRVDITAEHGHRAGGYRDVFAEVTTEPDEGAVSLVVRFDPRQNAYRFEFRDEDNLDEVTSNLAYEPGPRVEQLVGRLDGLAKGRSGREAAQVRGALVASGAELWRELVPKGLRDQFWARQHRIRQLTILADKDAVPWELLYPMDPGHDEGFLVEQFPVTRAIFGLRRIRRLSLWPARFVLPGGSLREAQDEIDAMRVSLDPGQPSGEVISRLTPLQDLIASGNFGLLHFACHNTYDPAGGSSIKLGNVQFTPTDLATAAINQVLARSAPTVFINACRSAGLNATYNRLDGWAAKFLEAGAAVFIGSLWAVSDGAAREFAQELYGQLQSGSSLGEAVKCARAAANQLDDPTWLAYAVYGDSRATLGQQRPWWSP